MGVIFTFECPKCKYKEDFPCGGAEGDDKYAIAEMSREKVFEQEILDGKYDEHLRSLYLSDRINHRFDCNVDFIQCEYCGALYHTNLKRIVYKGAGYTEIVDAEQNCKECGKPLNFLGFDRFTPVCPHCKNITLKNTLLSRF